MSQQHGGTPPSIDDSNDQSASTASAAKDEAATVARSAGQGGQQVASAAADQGRRVAGEAADQARSLLAEAREQAGEQVGTQQQRAVETLRSVGGDLTSMAEQGDDAGLATRLVREAADRVQQAAGWLEDRDPQTLMSDVRGYARRSPGTFLLTVAAAGLVAGRLTRATADERRGTGSDGPAQPVPAAPPVAQPTTPPVAPAAPAAPAVAATPQYDPVPTIDPPTRFGGYATDPAESGPERYR